MERDKYGMYYTVCGNGDDFVNIFSRDELSLLGVPQEAFEASRKGPVTFKLTFEVL